MRLDRFRPGSVADRIGVLALGSLLWATAALAAPAVVPQPGPGAQRVAFLPLHNLAASTAPVDELRARFLAVLAARGVDLVEEPALAEFLRRNRIRYSGGVEAATAEAFRSELGVTAVLVGAVELYDDGDPPAIALTARLVLTNGALDILWMDAVQMAGEQSPGLLDLGLVHELERLRERAIDRLARSAVDALGGARQVRRADGLEPGEVPAGPGRFAPRRERGSLGAAPGAMLRIAVVPFVNRSTRLNAGELVALDFVRLFSASPAIQVMEPGVVRAALLRGRVVQSEGLSPSQADLVRDLLDVDVVVTGSVLDYSDVVGTWAHPFVQFTVRAFDSEKREVSWASYSRGRGGDGVWLFDRGRVYTAPQLSARLARGVVARMLKP